MIRERTQVHCTQKLNQSTRMLATPAESKMGRERTLVVKSITDPENAKHHPRNGGSGRVLAIEETGLEAAECGRRSTALGKLAVEVDERGEVTALTGRLSTEVRQCESRVQFIRNNQVS